MVVVVCLEEHKFSFLVLVDSLQGPKTATGTSGGANLGIEHALLEQLADFVGDFNIDWAVFIASSQDRTADREIEIVADVADGFLWMSNEGNLGQVHFRKVSRICTFEVKDTH